jgi:hypothetical protein
MRKQNTASTMSSSQRTKARPIPQIAPPPSTTRRPRISLPMLAPPEPCRSTLFAKLTPIETR